MAILNRFSAILLYCDSTHFSASRCGISGDSGPAILGIVRFAIRDSVPLRPGRMKNNTTYYRSSKWHYRQRKLILELITMLFIADTDTDKNYFGINFS